MGTRALLLALLLLPAAVLARELPDFTELVERQSPAVVNVSTQRGAGERRGLRGGEPDDLFRRFFPPERGERRSLGSGFIIRSDGYVLTSLHVVEDADEILVTLNDRRVLEARLVGADSRSDLALLKIDAQELPAVSVGSSEALRVGEWVLAIGSPFGFEHSVTTGVVSAKGRNLPSDEENYVPFIQSDVAINPGNSGGPLFNLDGEVVGVNSQIYTRSGGFMGVSFSIPIDVAMEVAEQLREYGRVRRGWLGVVIREVDHDRAQGLELDRPQGALVVEVQAGSPAEAAGLQEDDVILAFNDRSIELSSELPQLVGRARAGSIAELLVMRDGQRHRFEVEIGMLGAADETAVATAQPGSDEHASHFGMTVGPLTDALRERLETNDGVQVIAVEGAAAESGVQEGDVITQLNNREIDSLETFTEVAAAITPGRSVPVLVLRDDTPTFLALRLPQE